MTTPHGHPALPAVPRHRIESLAGHGRERMVLNMGPQHPATHGTLRIILELDGEIVTRATPEIGFLHTGFEKIGEDFTYTQFITVSDRMNYLSAMNNNVGFALAVEEMLGIAEELPPRARVLRIIMCELSRIADHIICVGLAGMDMGAFSVMLWCFQEREKIYDLFEQACGSRLTTSYTRFGGLFRDVPEGWRAQCRTVVGEIPRTLDEVEAILNRNRIFRDRLDGVGVLSRDEAIAYGVTGPCARASGLGYDVRRARPYLGYEDYDFEIPVLAEGDCYARYRLRLLEMRQSLRILRQALDRLEPGPVLHPDHKLTFPPKADVHSDMESLIHQFKIVMEGHGVKPPRGEVYSLTEVPNGELGFHLVSDGSAKPWRIRLRSPSFINYTAFPHLAQGRLISDLPAILSSLNVIAGELDR